MFIKKHRSEHGFSLLELLIVISILGIAAAVAIPDISTTNPGKLELAAEEFAQAMRFARSEAMRTGQPHGFRQNSDVRRIRVFRPNTGTSPWSLNYDVYHPLSKQLYDIKLKEHSIAAVGNVSHNRVFRGTCNKPRNVYFDGNGTPWCANPENVLLDQIALTLTLGTHTRTVTLHGITGRVTVQ